MKRVYFMVIALFLLMIPAYSQSVDLEIFGQYFNPTEEAFKDIYGSGIMWGGGASIGIVRNLDLWLAGSVYSKAGELTFTKEQTKIKITPLEFGIAYTCPASKFLHIYGGVGLSYCLFKEENPIGTVTENKLGFLIKGGGLIKIQKSVFFDLFLKYNHCKIQPEDFEVNIGGFSIGLGFGLTFELKKGEGGKYEKRI